MLSTTAAQADYDYSCRCITNKGCRYDTEIIKIKVSGPEVTAQVLRYSDVTLSFLLDSKYSPDHNVSFYQYLPNPEKADALPDGPLTLWIEKPLVQGGYRLSSGATGGFLTIPGDHPSTFVCALN
jgi:hypothetical protein